MDGAAAIGCRPESSCPPRPQFRYVDNASEILSPYLELATQYGWANEMFQTNQGPSFPAHQFLFGATSAPSREDDRKGVFVSENLPGTGQPDTPPDNGCMARKSARIQLIDPNGTESTQNRIYPCLEHRTVADLLDDHGLEWRYFAPGAGNLWTAPDAISHLCQPRKRQCTGEEWQKHLVLKPARVLDEIRHCRLAQVSWIIPSGQESDHAFLNRGLGPSWVASIVNEIGNSACRDNNGARFWNSTAIVVVWDDWGGWYDHEAPSLLRYPQGGYQYGFRVPLLFISAYTQKGYINDERLDFGSIVRFVEHNFGIRKGELTFADARAHGDLGHFYDLAAHPRPFKTIKAPRTADFFLHDTAPLTPPDDD
jgi:phospholipase C